MDPEESEPESDEGGEVEGGEGVESDDDPLEGDESSECSPSRLASRSECSGCAYGLASLCRCRLSKHDALTTCCR